MAGREVRAGRAFVEIVLRDKLQAYVAGGGQLVPTSGNLAKLPGGLGGHTRVTATLATNIGKGRLTILASEFGVDFKAGSDRVIRSVVDRPLARPYELRGEVRQALDAIFRGQRLFDARQSGTEPHHLPQGSR